MNIKLGSEAFERIECVVSPHQKCDEREDDRDLGIPVTQLFASLVAAAAAVACAAATSLLASRLRDCARAWKTFVAERPEAFEDGLYWSVGTTGRLGESGDFVPAALLASMPKRD